MRENEKGEGKMLLNTKFDDDVQVNEGFDIVAKGIYRMKVSEAKGPEKNENGINNINWVFKFVEAPSTLLAYEHGKIVKNPGSLFYKTCVDSGMWDNGSYKQAKLKTLAEASGISWTSWKENPDTDRILGQEFDVAVDVETIHWQTKEPLDKPRNVIKKLIIKK